MTFNENLTFQVTVTPIGGQPQNAFVNNEVEILMYDNFPETKNAKYAVYPISLWITRDTGKDNCRPLRKIFRKPIPGEREKYVKLIGTLEQLKNLEIALK